MSNGVNIASLCLHTLRADCNIQRHAIIWRWTTLPPHAPCRLQQHPSCGIRLVETALPPHAPCRLQRGLNGRMVETENFASTRSVQIATPRTERGNVWAFSLPPHAPCRLQRSISKSMTSHVLFASTRSVQIATPTLDAVTNITVALPPHAPCRLQRQKCTELQYALFRTCVESVDSFSVLNKAMLR